MKLLAYYNFHKKTKKKNTIYLILEANVWKSEWILMNWSGRLKSEMFMIAVITGSTNHHYYIKKEPVAKEPVYWNDFSLLYTTTRYSRCGQKSCSYYFFLFRSFQCKRFIQAAYFSCIKNFHFQEGSIN